MQFSRFFLMASVATSLTGACAAQTTNLKMNAIDSLSFGDAASQTAHQVVTERAEVVRGGLDESALRLLPLTPASWDGGSVSFTLKVDPQQQNYVTVRLWGGDKGEDAGNLVLYADGKQLGYRMQSDYDLLNQMDAEGQAPGRFFYETRPLPLWMTQGKTTMQFKIVALGRIWSYGDTFERFQKKLEVPSRGIYTAYTHVNPRLQAPPSEKQGQFPRAELRPATAPGPEVIAQSKRVVIERLRALLAAPVGPKWSNLSLLAEAYNVEWTPAYKNPAALNYVLKEGDNLASAYADPKFDNGWVGAGPLGGAIARMWPEIGQHMDEPFAGQGLKGTRREVWSYVLRRSIDFWRTHRRSFTNQSMFVDYGIYNANRGLRLIDPGKALPEAKALRYVHESVGLAPWLGSDIVDEKGERAAAPYGNKYFLFTRENLSRELGWVGSYGETILQITRELAEITGDDKVRQQVGKIHAARMAFRYPGLDKEGYRTMKMVSEIDNRTSHFPYSGAAYSSSEVRESWGLHVAALVPEALVAVGAAQRYINDGQYFVYIQGRLNDPNTEGMMRNVADYEKVKALPVVKYTFPMEDGQPDFVFADEENAVIALKHGETRLFVNLYFRAENAVNNVAKILEITPTTMRNVTARTNTKVNESGQSFTRQNYSMWMRGDAKPHPPGQKINQAWAGEVLPIAKRPEGATEPAYGKWGPFIGQAAFHWVTYGDYLIGLNTTADSTYDLPVPEAGRAYTDLVTKQRVSPVNGVVKVPPLSTVVLYLGD